MATSFTKKEESGLVSPCILVVGGAVQKGKYVSPLRLYYYTLLLAPSTVLNLVSTYIYTIILPMYTCMEYINTCMYNACMYM
jgi:hypothetical protein